MNVQLLIVAKKGSLKGSDIRKELLEMREELGKKWMMLFVFEEIMCACL